MAEKIVLADTSILIEFWKKDKSKTKLFQLLDHFDTYSISAITEFEIFSGANEEQKLFWNQFLERIIILPFDSQAADTASRLFQTLKRVNKQIDIADLFIASTALANNLPLATLNKKHFERIEQLEITK